jgi:hypothetical protein
MSKPMQPNAAGVRLHRLFFVFQVIVSQRSFVMLWTLVVILLVLWCLGMVTSYTAGGLIHILLVVALVVIVIRLLQGRRPLT